MQEDQLNNLGVSMAHINSLKKMIVLPTPQNRYCYKIKKVVKMSVPVKKIVGLGVRSESGYSWWEHFIKSRGKLNRLGNLQKTLIDKGLKDFKNTFKQETFSKGIEMD